MTFALPGSPDFQQQVSGSMVFLQTVSVNLAPGASMFPDITAAVQPNFQSLAFLWDPSSNIADVLACSYQVTGNFPHHENFITALPMAITQMPFIGAALVNVPALSLQLDLFNPNAGNVTGSLYVFGVTAPAFVTPIRISEYEGLGTTTGLVSVGAGATVTILAAPAVGKYYRLKGINYRAGGAAPAANLPITFKALSSGAELCVYASKGTANEADRFPCDIAWVDGVSMTNSTGVAILGVVMYEIWTN